MGSGFAFQHFYHDYGTDLLSSSLRVVVPMGDESTRAEGDSLAKRT